MRRVVLLPQAGGATRTDELAIVDLQEMLSDAATSPGVDLW